MISPCSAPNSGKPKLLVILGAGSSIPCRMPSVDNINDQMKDWSREWKPETESPGGAGAGVFNDLWDSVERYYLVSGVNYERVLGEMTALASWLAPSPWGDPLREIVKDGALLSAFQKLDRGLIMEEQSFLLKKLAEYMRERCNRPLDKNSPPFANYREIFSRLREQFDLGIYNLNYDNVARSAWHEAFNGFNDYGVFDPPGVSLRREWEFIYHLHGSVHYCLNTLQYSGTLRKPPLIWKDDLINDSFVDQYIRSPDLASKFLPIPLTTLIAGGFKLDQLLADPHQTFYSTLVRHVHEADAILIAGYGFGDLHVNSALRNRFDCSDYKVPYPLVVVLTKSCPDTREMARRQSGDFWAFQLTHTLDIPFANTSDIRVAEKQPLTVAPFIENQEFEVPSYGKKENHIVNRVGIWHGGFIEVLDSFDKMAERLRR